MVTTTSKREAVRSFAEQIGCVHELDELCASRALMVASDLPEKALLFLDMAPKTLELDSDGNKWLSAAVERAGFAPDRVVVEVTERIEDEETLEFLRGVEALDVQPGTTIIQGGQGFELGYPSPQMPSEERVSPRIASRSGMPSTRT